MNLSKTIRIAVFFFFTLLLLPEGVWGSWRDDEVKPGEGQALWNHKGTTLYSVHIEHNDPATGKTYRVHLGATFPIEARENSIHKNEGDKPDVCLFFDRRDLKGREIVCLIPGRAGHMGEDWIKETTHDLEARNFAVVLMDAMGQGHSSGNLNHCESHPKLNCCPRKGHIDDFQDYTRGMLWFLTNVRAAAGQKVVLFPHSLSGAVYLRLRMEYPKIDDECVKAAYPLAPMIQFKTPPFPLWFSEWVVSWMCSFGYGDSYALGRGPEKDAVDHAHQEMHVGGPTYQWVNDSFIFTRALRDESFFWHFENKEICLLTPGNDATVSPEATNAFAHENDIRIKKFPDFWHDALKEKEEWRTEVLNFIEGDLIEVRDKRLEDLESRIGYMGTQMYLMHLMMQSPCVISIFCGEILQKRIPEYQNLVFDYQTELKIAGKMNPHCFKRIYPCLFSKKSWPSQKLTWLRN